MTSTIHCLPKLNFLRFVAEVVFVHNNQCGVRCAGKLNQFAGHSGEMS